MNNLRTVDRFEATLGNFRRLCHGIIRNVNTLELNSNILSITPTRTITYDYNDKGTQTREVGLTRRRTRMLFIHRLAWVYVGLYVC